MLAINRSAVECSSLVIRRSNSHSLWAIKLTDSRLDTGAFGAARVFTRIVNSGILVRLLRPFKMHTLYTYLTCDRKIYI